MKKILKIGAGIALIAATIASTLPTVACSEKDEDDKLFETCVTYGEFGAVGDGKTDDFAALKKTHEYANEHNVAVKAERGKKYYIPAVEDKIVVKTNVDWTGAEFIIDDKSAAEDSKVWWYPVFHVQSDTEKKELEIPEGMSFKAGQTRIGLTFEEPVLLMVYNENKLDFIRYGSSQEHGYPRQEPILVDEEGKIDPSTPLQWDYETVTKAVAYSVTDTPLLLRGGKFTTIANDDSVHRNYFDRGIRVERSNTRVKNVEHYVTEEGTTGSAYNGFFRANYVNNVLFENCVMTGHKLFKNQYGSDQGTYDTKLGYSNHVGYKNCIQANDHTDPAYWGVMCSDYCKNLFMDGCKLSRFDAHMGVYNATITNCDIGQHISVTGGGLLKIENIISRAAPTSTYFNRFVTLRNDYGSFFDGDVIIKDSTLITARGINYIFGAAWYDWDFGYECRFPKTVTLDNVQFKYENVPEGTYLHPCLYIFSKLSDETYENALKSKNPPVLTEKVIIKNNTDPQTGKEKTAYEIITNEGKDWFKDTLIVKE